MFFSSIPAHLLIIFVCFYFHLCFYCALLFLFSLLHLVYDFIIIIIIIIGL